MPKKGAARASGVFLYKAGGGCLARCFKRPVAQGMRYGGCGGRLGRERAWRELRTSAVNLGACAEVAPSGYTRFENKVTQIKISSF